MLVVVLLHVLVSVGTFRRLLEGYSACLSVFDYFSVFIWDVPHEDTLSYVHSIERAFSTAQLGRSFDRPH